MRKTTIVLLCAVALVSAGPYLRIPESHSQTHANYQAGYYNQQQPESSAFASASSSSNSYASSSASAQTKTECNPQQQQQQSIHKSDNNYDQTVQVGVKGFPPGFHTGHYRPENTDELAKREGKGDKYWWSGDNSPFGPDGKAPPSASGCSSNGCVASASFDLNRGSGHASTKVGLNFQSNPFFQAGSTFQNSGASFQNSGAAEISKPDHSSNPFLNGAVSSSSSSAASIGVHNAHAYPTTTTTAAPLRPIGAGNPFIINAGYEVPSSTPVPVSVPSVNSFGSGNPFFNAVNSVNTFVPLQSTVVPPFPSQSQEQSFDQYDQQQNVEQSSGFGLKLSCSGQGKICISKNMCNNGFVSSQHVQGLTQIRSGNQHCDIDREVCCTISSESADQSPAGSVFGSVNLPSNNGIIYRPEQSNGLFGDANDQDFDFSTGDNHISKSSSSSGGATVNGYLPPDGNPSNTIESVLKPIPPTQKPKIPAVIEPAPTHLDNGGCAAALVCVEEFYCHMNGTASKSALDMTDAQREQRVALSDCKISNSNGGVYGKCCRDPDYTDPWPTGNLPKDYTGGFDEQGFPTFLNIQRNRPPTHQQPKPVVPIKTSFSSVKTPFPSTPQQPPRQIYTTSHPPVEQGFINVYSSPRPVVQPAAPTVIPIFNPTTQVGFTQYSTTPKYSQIPVDEPSSTNVKLTILPPHVPGSQCGVKNSVERPSGLSDVDVAFGEIPWEAMILSNREKKLLCSGALIAPNAVLTAARCLDGYRPYDVSIKVGEWKLGFEAKEEEPLPFEIVTVERIISHPGYLTGYAAYDVAILLLEHPVHLDRHVDTICLSDEKPRPDMKCISTGWGKVILQSHVAGALMHSIDVDVIGREECQQRLEGAESKLEIDDSLVCGKAHRKNNNMCQVDLGGPLACDRGDGTFAIMGVYNQDTGCLPTNQVTTFATIDKAWIEYTLANPPPKTIPQTDIASVEETEKDVSPSSQAGINIYQQSNFESPQYLPPHK